MAKFIGPLLDRDNLALRRLLVDEVPETIRQLEALGVTFMGPLPEPPHGSRGSTPSCRMRVAISAISRERAVPMASRFARKRPSGSQRRGWPRHRRRDPRARAARPNGFPPGLA